MRIVIATGIFEPEAGGPATYAPQLAARLAEAGQQVSVLTLSNHAAYATDAGYSFSLTRIVRTGRFSNRLRFFFALVRAARSCDLIYTLDWFAVGVPVFLVARLFRLPYVVRVGGDYLWEQRYFERAGEEPITLKEFYARGIHARPSYAPFFYLIRAVLGGAAHVVFNSDTQRELYLRFYRIRRERASTILNPLPMERQIPSAHPSKEFVFWGRFVAMKNLTSLIRAFVRAERLRGFTLALIGEGPQRRRLEELVRNLELDGRVSIEHGMPFRAVLERVKNCRAFVLPSWTDIAPNQVMEALALGLPALVTRENYLSIAEALPLSVDPHSTRDIASKLELLADEHAYRAFRKKFNAISFSQSWDDVLREHLRIFAGVLGRELLRMRVLQIGSDRSKRGILHPDSAGFKRQEAYARKFGALDIVGFSLRSDGVQRAVEGALCVYPTHSLARLLYWFDALRIARSLPRPDVVSVQDPFETGLVGFLIARRFRVPLHVQVHTDFLSPEYAKLSFLNKTRVLIAGFVLRRAERIRVVSERIRKSLEQRYRLKTPVSVLPIFADVETFRVIRPDEELTKRFATFSRRLLVVARLEPEKNVSLALESFAKSAPKDACLVVVGEGSERAALERRALILQVSERVFFEGERDASAYYSIADLVLVPSLYEGYGLVVVEALSAGKPVLSTDVGIAREAGAIVASSEKFSEALADWFANGPREGSLKNYPYKTFDEYVRAYCDDVAACARARYLLQSRL